MNNRNMKKLNFQQFSLPTGIKKEQRVTGDARESIANVLYLNVNGIRAHHLAFKIFESEGEQDYADDEIELLKEVVNRYCLPNFIDGLKEQLNKE